MKTALHELKSELQYIKENNCKTIQEMLFFDGVLALIETKYLEKEKEQIIQSYEYGLFEDGEYFFNEKFKS